MPAQAEALARVAGLDPREAAERLLAQQQGTEWLDAFAEHLDRYRAGQSLARTLQTWDLSQAAAARVFGVSRQAISKWMDKGAPAERAAVIADLAAATDLLVRYLKRDRIAAVVRRPISALGNQTLVGLVESGQSRELLQAVRDMFSFDQAQT